MPGALKLVTVFPSMSWLFALMAKTRRVCVSFRGLYLVELKIEYILVVGLLVESSVVLVS